MKEHRDEISTGTYQHTGVNTELMNDKLTVAPACGGFIGGLGVGVVCLNCRVEHSGNFFVFFKMDFCKFLACFLLSFIKREELGVPKPLNKGEIMIKLSKSSLDYQLNIIFIDNFVYFSPTLVSSTNRDGLGP